MRNSVLAGMLVMTQGLALGSEAMKAIPSPEHPTGWRNDGTGHYPGTMPPTEWSQIATNGSYECRNIVWKTRIPFHGASSPLVVGDRIFVTGSGGAGDSPVDLMCMDALTGKALWIKTLTFYHTVSDAEKRKFPPVPDFAVVEMAAKPLADKLQQMDDELVAKVNVASATSKATLYPAQFPLNLPGAGGNPNPLPQPDAIEVGFNRTRHELAVKLNRLMADYDQQRYKLQSHGDFGYASATPCSDGTNVYVYFSNRIAACFDLDGNCRWAGARPLLMANYEWHGSHGSPFLAEGKLVISYGAQVLAVDCRTGEQLWVEKVQARPSTEEGIGYSSLALARVGNEPLAVLVTGQGVSLATGHTVWGRLPEYQGENTSPVVQDGTLFTFERSGIRATPLPAAITEGTKLVSKTWIRPKEIATNLTGSTALSSPADAGFNNYAIASPLIIDGLVYCVNDKGVLVVVDTKESQIVYKRKLDMKVVWPGLSASPALAGGHIYIVGNQGATFVIKPGRVYQEIACNVIESLYNAKGEREKFLASPAFAGKRIFLRGEQYLYCIGQ